MFRKKDTVKETHSGVETWKYLKSIGSCIENLPKLRHFSFKEIALPEDYTHPLEGYFSEDAEHYAIKLYLPKHIFILIFEFDCKEDKFYGLPKITFGQIITTENIDVKLTTKQFLHLDKVTHQQVQREHTEYIVELANLSLEEYLKTHGPKIDNVDKFLSIYIPAERKFQRDTPLNQGSRLNVGM